MRAQSRDTRLLVVGVVAFLALVVYLGVAFANTHASSGALSSTGNPFGYWVAHNANLARVPHPKRQPGLTVRVSPAARGSYGVLVPTLVSDPTPGRTYAVGLWLRGARPGRIAVAIDEFQPNASSVYVVNTTVPATTRWRHFTFKGHVVGRWLGLGMYVSRQSTGSGRKWFEVRGLTAELRGSPPAPG
jgi:hypothetical protein